MIMTVGGVAVQMYAYNAANVAVASNGPHSRYWPQTHLIWSDFCEIAALESEIMLKR
jgi:hypothetical protein